MTYPGARYLLRFDDLCPTMSRTGWDRFEPLLVEYGIRPILAVVPDNRDPELVHEVADCDFWSRMRQWEHSGAVIALHGYRHLCQSSGKALLPLHRYTEFAGVDEETQRAWIEAGLAILRGHGLHPQLFVAPRHGFDSATLRALRAAGIGTISDGLTHRPLVRDGVTWIPQQLWKPAEQRNGLWTICLHSNSAPNAEVLLLRDFLRAHASQFISVPEALSSHRSPLIGWIERVRCAHAVWRIRAKRWAKKATRL